MPYVSGLTLSDAITNCWFCRHMAAACFPHGSILASIIAGVLQKVSKTEARAIVVMPPVTWVTELQLTEGAKALHVVGESGSRCCNLRRMLQITLATGGHSCSIDQRPPCTPVHAFQQVAASRLHSSVSTSFRLTTASQPSHAHSRRRNLVVKAESSPAPVAPWQTADARLVLQDGSVWKGKAFGATDTEIGEVVFNTSITGYEEIMTDPSYRGQFVVFTHPHIGNVGINLGESCFFCSST